MDVLITVFSMVLLLLYPLGNIFLLSFGQGIRVSPIDVGVCLLTILGSIYFFLRKRPFPKIYIPIGLFLLTCLFSLCVNSGILGWGAVVNASLYFFRFILYTGIILTVSQFSKKEKEKILCVLFISGFLLMLCGYGQFFFFPSLDKLVYEGWDRHFYRMFGSFLDPNFFGSFLVLFTLLSFYLFLKKTALKLFFGVTSIFAIIALFLSFSRSAYIALGVGVVVFLFCKGYKRRILQSLLILISIGIIVVALLARQTEGDNLLRTASTAARFNNLFRAGAIIHDSPIFGVGFDAYKYAQHRKGFEVSTGWDDSHGNNGVNNSYLFIWATTGIIGLIAYLFFLKRAILIAQMNNEYGSLVIASFVAITANSLFENTLFYSFIMLWLFILLGFIENSE